MKLQFLLKGVSYKNIVITNICPQQLVKLRNVSREEKYFFLWIRSKIIILFNRKISYFINTPNGVLQIMGSTIHYTDDSERQKIPQGYFIVAKLWDDEFIENLSKTDIKSGTISTTKLLLNDSSYLSYLFEFSFNRIA